MTSLFDQYEQESQRTISTTAPQVDATAPGIGYINMNLDTDNDTPIFTKQTVNFKPTDRVTHLSVNNETIVLIMTNNILLRINLSKTQQASSDSKNSSKPQSMIEVDPPSSEFNFINEK